MQREVITRGHPTTCFVGWDSQTCSALIKESPPDLILDNETIKSLTTKKQLSDWFQSRYGNRILTNNIPQSSYSALQEFPESQTGEGGIGIKYGTTPGFDNPVTLIEISDLPIPKEISFSFRYENLDSVMCYFDILYKTDKATYTLLNVIDPQYRVTEDALANIITDNRTQVYAEFSGQGVHTYDVHLQIPENTPHCFTQGETRGNLIISSCETYIEYVTNWVYIKDLRILF